MKTIPLTKGYEAIVDDEDYDYLMQWKWHALVGKHVYAERCERPRGQKIKHILMHRVINKTPDGMVTDHDNGNGLDNRRHGIATPTKKADPSTRELPGTSSTRNGTRPFSSRNVATSSEFSQVNRLQQTPTQIKLPSYLGSSTRSLSMSDMRATIEPKSDRLNADDLIGINGKTIKITKVAIVSGDQPVSLGFDGDGGKPWYPCKSMRRVLVNVWGNNANAYVGRSLTLYRDEKVRFGGAEVGGIRISHMSHISEPITMALTASRAQRKPYTVQPLAGGTPSAEDKAINEAFDALIAEANAATTLEAINDVAKKAGKNKGVSKAKVEEMREIVTRKRAEFSRQPGDEG